MAAHPEAELRKALKRFDQCHRRRRITNPGGWFRDCLRYGWVRKKVAHVAQEASSAASARQAHSERSAAEQARAWAIDHAHRVRGYGEAGDFAADYRALCILLNADADHAWRLARDIAAERHTDDPLRVLARKHHPDLKALLVASPEWRFRLLDAALGELHRERIADAEEDAHEAAV